MRAWVFLLCGMVLLGSPRFFAASVTTAFQLGEQGGIIVAVFINGAGPFRMLLDTGATHSAITDEAARASGARAVAQSVIVSAAGSAVRVIVSVDRLELGPVVQYNVLPSVAPDGAFGKGIHGLIGQDVLAALTYTLDFDRRIVEWHDAPLAYDAGTALTLAYEQGRFLVRLPQDTMTLRLVPDSGAGGVVLFRTDGSASLPVLETGRTVELTTGAGAVEGRHVRLRQLRVGEHTLRNVPAVRVPRTELRPAEGDGLLPLHLFDRVTFDGPGRILILGRIRGPAS